MSSTSMQDLEQIEPVPEPVKEKKRIDPVEKADARARKGWLIIGAAAIASAFTYLQFSIKAVCCGDFDGYYHIRWSRLLWEGIRHGHFPPKFEWLPLTTLNPKDYVDHHLLFHVFQIPFTWFGNLPLGAKVSAALFASLSVFAGFALIVRYRIRFALVWLIALMACSAPFLYRMSMAKAPPFAIIYTVAGIYLLFEKRYWLLLPLTFLFALTYDLFVLLPIATVIWVGVNLWAEEKFEGRPVLWTGLGSIAGFVVNPYFPKNVTLFAEHAMMKLNPTGFTTAVGQEWYPYESWYFLGSCFVAFVAMVAGYMAYDGSDRRAAIRPLFFLILATLLLVVNADWRRFVEYWPPFAVLFAAFSLKPYLEGHRSVTGKLPEHLLSELEPFLDKRESPQSIKDKWKSIREESTLAFFGAGIGFLLFCVVFNARLLRAVDESTHITHHNKVALILLIAEMVLYAGLMAFFFFYWSFSRVIALFSVSVLALIFFVNFDQTRESFKSDAKADQYKGGMAWIRENVPAGQVIFNTDWDDFPKLFYYDTSHVYVSGLDPTYLLDQSPELSKLYVDITLGHESDPGPLIRDKFGAKYVFTDNEHDPFVNAAMDSGWFQRAYEDNDCTVLKIRDSKSEANKGEDNPNVDTGEGDTTGDEEGEQP